MGPIATPRPAVADQIPMARPRSRSVLKTFVRIDSVQGISAAAPAPVTAGPAVSDPTLPEKAEKAEPAAKTASPARNTHFRPTRSPSAPREQQQSREGDGVGVDDPLQLARRGVQVPDDGRERDAQDGQVQAHQE